LWFKSVKVSLISGNAALCNTSIKYGIYRLTLTDPAERRFWPIRQGDVKAHLDHASKNSAILNTALRASKSNLYATQLRLINCSNYTAST
jgi:hypothetical protein